MPPWLSSRSSTSSSGLATCTTALISSRRCSTAEARMLPSKSSTNTRERAVLPFFCSFVRCLYSFFRLDVGLALMGVEKIVIEDIRHLLETAVEVLHLQVLGRIFAGMTGGIEEKADQHADRDDEGGDFGQEQAVLQQVVQHVKAPVEISSAYQGAEF